MSARNPCPNCNAPRTASDAACEVCDYPRHVRVRVFGPARAPRPIQPFRFSLATLLACVTISAFTFGLLEWLGLAGAFIAWQVGAVAYPLINLSVQCFAIFYGGGPFDRKG
jgi:hypothetical protein